MHSQIQADRVLNPKNYADRAAYGDQTGPAGSRFFLLLAGNLRFLALKELGQDNAPYLIAKDFETYTYNHRINRFSTVQEYFMLRRAIDKGVSKEPLARAFNGNLSTINSGSNLLHMRAPFWRPRRKNNAPTSSHLSPRDIL